MAKSRRDFFKFFGLAAFSLGTALLSKAFPARGEERRARRGGAGGAELALVKPGVGMAASVNYVEKHSDVKDAKLKVVRQGVPFEKQFCNNCVLYTKQGERNGKEVGLCTLFANQVVKGEGWCTSWAKKS
jgi:hypothetical protein